MRPADDRPRKPARVPYARWTSPRARPARVRGRAARRGARRGDRLGRRRARARARHDRRQSRALDAERRAPREGDRGPRLHGLDRHLPERDDAPRRRDPADAPRRSSAATTTSCFHAFSVRNHAKWSPPALPKPARCAARLGDRARDRGARERRDPRAARRDALRGTARKRAALVSGRLGSGRAREARQRARPGSTRRPDAARRPLRRSLRRRRREDSRSRSCKAAEHGVDLGPLASRLPAMLATGSGEHRARAGSAGRRHRRVCARRSRAPCATTRSC